MAVSKFLGTLFLFSLFMLFYDIESVQNDIKQNEKPMVSFYNTISYTIDNKNVKSILRSDEVYFFQGMEEMVGATILMRDNNVELSNFAKANYVTKIEDDFYLDGDVFIRIQDSMELKTEELEFNIETQIARNNLPFVLEDGNNIFKGEELFFDLKNHSLNGKNIKFSLKDIDD